MTTIVRKSDAPTLRPSEVFAQRLRETRESRRLTQDQLAEKLSAAGVTLGRRAIIDLEAGKRRVSIDELLAIAAELNAVPEHLLAPPEGSFVRIDENFGMDALGFREFMRYGFPWSLDAVPPEYLPDEEREMFQLRLAALALGIADAYRAVDRQGIKDGVDKLIDEVKQRYVEVVPAAARRTS